MGNRNNHMNEHGCRQMNHRHFSEWMPRESIIIEEHEQHRPQMPMPLPCPPCDDDWEDEMEMEISSCEPSFLHANVGNLVRVEFLIGNMITERTGILRKVCPGYIVLKSANGESKIMCDIDAIKFVTVV